MPEYSGLKIDAFGDISVCPHMKTPRGTHEGV
jgi:hypothetical protein